MGVREHRRIGELVRHAREGVDELVHEGADELRTAVAEHEGVREVVDVLRRAAEVDHLDRVLKLRHLGRIGRSGTSAKSW